jgi:uncharacterized protein YutE (UPF0331/DUF86 family)
MSPGRLDAEVVRRHLRALDVAVRQLRAHQGKAPSALEESLDELWAVERGLQLFAQNCLDVATHLAASAGIDAPDYATAVDALVRMQVLPKDFGGRFRAIAGFRNVLVHGYLAVDVDRVHALLNERLDDFATFAEHVERHVAG